MTEQTGTHPKMLENTSSRPPKEVRMKNWMALLAGLVVISSCGQTPNAPRAGTDLTAVTGGTDADSEAQEGLKPQLTIIGRLCNLGPLDTTFGRCGKLLTGLGPNGNPNVEFQNTRAIAIQPDGKLLVAGYVSGGRNDDRALVVRLNTNGSVDSSFAGTGFQRINPTVGISPFINKIIVQPDGKILINGSIATRGLFQRLNGDGSYNTGFSSPFNNLENVRGNDMALQSDGKILLNENIINGYGNNQSHLYRFNPDGSPDLGFSNTTDLSNSGIIHATSSGRIIVTTNDNSGVVAKAFTSTGAVDTSFGTAGTNVVFTNRVWLIFDPRTGRPRFETTLCVQTNSIQQPNGKILVSGACNNAFIMGRINADGSSDSSFGDSGVKYDPSLPAMTALAVQPNGNIVVGGSENDDFLLARFNSAGARDTVWGGSGKVRTGFGARAGITPVDSVIGLVTSSDGKIIAAGNSFIQLDPYNSRPADPVGFALARYWN